MLKVKRLLMKGSYFVWTPKPTVWTPTPAYHVHRDVDVLDPSRRRARPRVQGLGFGVWGSGFRVWGSGFGVQGSEFGVQNLGSRVEGLGSRVPG